MIGIGRVEPKWRVTLSSSVLNTLQLKKNAQLFLYFDYSPEYAGAGGRLVGLPYTVTTSSFQGETRGSKEEILELIYEISSVGKFDELFMRRGRTMEYSLNYVISILQPEGENVLQKALTSKGRPIYNQCLVSLGEGGKLERLALNRL